MIIMIMEINNREACWRYADITTEMIENRNDGIRSVESILKSLRMYTEIGLDLHDGNYEINETERAMLGNDRFYVNDILLSGVLSGRIKPKDGMEIGKPNKKDKKKIDENVSKALKLMSDE